MFGSPTSRKNKKRSSPVAAMRPTTMTLEELLDALRQLRSGTRFAGGETLRCSPWKAWHVQLLSREFGVWREIWCWKWLLLHFLSAVYVDDSKVLHSCTCILHVCVNMMLSRIQRIHSLKLTAKALTISLPKRKVFFKTINFQVLNMQPIGSMYGILTYLHLP